MTKLEEKLRELNFVPKHYNRLAEACKITLPKLRQYVAGTKKIGAMDTVNIVNGIYAILGKNIKPEEITGGK